MDGVIADTNPFHKKVIKEFCIRHNKFVDDKILEEKVYGRTNKEWITEVFGSIPDAEIEELANEKEQIFRDEYAAHLKAVDGLIGFLEKVKSDSYRLAIGTSAPWENAEFILSGLNIKHYFSAILSSEDVSVGKPHPEIYQKAASGIDLLPEQCIVFEDSLAGVMAGKNAGCSVIGITTTHSKEELSNCELVIENFNNLKPQDLHKLIYKK